MDKILMIAENEFEEGVIYKRKEIEEVFKNKGIENPRNITSMTYNRWNKGMSNAHLTPIFEYMERNKYRYIGPSAAYTGDIYHDPKGKDSIAYKIGSWLNGRVFDYEGRLSEFNFNIEELPRSNDTSTDWFKTIKNLGFELAGTYKFINDKTCLKSAANVNRSERVSLVYALIVNGSICYLGKTVQGYNRPFSYHKNRIMSKVRDGIKDELINGYDVEVWCMRFEEPLTWNGLDLNIIEAVEQALITQVEPKWNKYKML